MGSTYTIKKMKILMNSAATQPDAIIRFHANDMCLHIDSDAACLVQPKALNRAAGHYYLSNNPPPSPHPSYSHSRRINTHQISDHPHRHGFFCLDRNWSDLPQRLAGCSYPHGPHQNGPPTTDHPNQDRQHDLPRHQHRQHVPEALQRFWHALPLDALTHQSEPITPLLAEVNWKPCRLIHQALPF